MTVEPVRFELAADTARAEKEVDSFFDSIGDRMTPTIDVVNLLGKAWELVTGAIGAAKDAVVDVVKASLESERTERQLTAALTARGAETQRLTGRLLAFNDEMERQTNLSAESLTALQSEALALGILPGHLERVTQATAGWAKLSGKDLHGALIDVVQVLDGRLPKSLAKIHPEIKTSTAALSFFASGLNLTRSEAQSTEGLIAALGIEFGNLKEDIGGSVSKSEQFRGLLRDMHDDVSSLRQVWKDLAADKSVDEFFAKVRKLWREAKGSEPGSQISWGRAALGAVAGALPGGGLLLSALDMRRAIGGGGDAAATPKESWAWTGQEPRAGLSMDILDGPGQPKNAKLKTGGADPRVKIWQREARNFELQREGLDKLREFGEGLRAFHAQIAAEQEDDDRRVEAAALRRHETRMGELRSVESFGTQLLDGLSALAHNTRAMNEQIGSELGSMAQGFGSAIGAGLAGAIGAIVEGSKGIGEAFADLAAQIFVTLGTQLLSMAAVLGILGIFNPALLPMAGAMGAAGIVATVAGSLIKRAAHGGGSSAPAAASAPSFSGYSGGRGGGGGTLAAPSAGAVARPNTVINVVIGAGAVIGDSRRELGKMLSEIIAEHDALGVT